MTLTLGIGRSFVRTLAAVDIGPITQIVLAPSTRSIDPTAPTSSVSATPEDAAGHRTADVVTYHSSSTSVATINSSSGAITWVGAGSTNITATFSAITSNTCVLTAASHGARSQVVMSPTTLSLGAGTTSTVTGTAEDSLGNATGDTVTYSSGNTAVATVNSSTGLVTWVAGGTVTITATSGAFTATCAVTAAAAGPTVQIASVPPTLTLAHGSTGSALAGTPKDINDVATGARKYYHSSDTNIVTVDPDTGVPTGVAAGSATITENFVAPVSGDPVPLVYNAGTDTRLWYEEFNYPDLTTFSTAYDQATQIALYPNTISPEQGIVDSDRPGKTVTERAFANNFNGIATDAPKCWTSIPESLRPDPARTISYKFWAKISIDLSHAPWTDQPLREKWFEVSHGQSRTQWSITDSGFNSGSDITSSVWNCPGQAFPTPVTLTYQQRGPYVGDILRAGGWHYYEMEHRTHTAAAGTVDIAVYTCLVKLRSGSPPAVGARMTLRTVSGSTLNALSSYEVTDVTAGSDLNGSYNGITLTRRDDGLTTTDYGYDPIEGFSLATYKMFFTDSQSGLLSVGDYIANYNGTAVGGFRITSILSGTQALATRNGDDVVGGRPQVEYGGCKFARSGDGFTGKSRMWIDGTLVLDHSLTAIGAPVVSATMQMLAQYPVAQPIQLVILGDNQTSGPGIWNPPESSPTPVTPWSIYYTQYEGFSRLEP